MFHFHQPPPSRPVLGTSEPTRHTRYDVCKGPFGFLPFSLQHEKLNAFIAATTIICIATGRLATIVASSSAPTCCYRHSLARRLSVSFRQAFSTQVQMSLQQRANQHNNRRQKQPSSEQTSQWTSQLSIGAENSRRETVQTEGEYGRVPLSQLSGSRKESIYGCNCGHCSLGLPTRASGLLLQLIFYRLLLEHLYSAHAPSACVHKTSSTAAAAVSFQDLAVVLSAYSVVWHLYAKTSQSIVVFMLLSYHALHGLVWLFFL